MLEFLKKLFDADFMPHGHCYFWLPEIVWLHVTSDILIALAYYSIPASLLYLASRRKDLNYKWMFMLFSAFILACGTTHILEVWTLWNPMYRLSGMVKLLTAAVSVATAALLVPLIPKALALPSPAQLREANQNLIAEIAERQKIEQQLVEAKDNLEKQVAKRTAELSKSNALLRQEVAERKRAEIELKMSKEYAEAASRTKSEFLANMSHELRTPMNAIIGFSEILEDQLFGELNKRQTTYVGNIVRSGAHLLKLINDILDLSKVEAGRMELDLQSIDVPAFVAEVTPTIEGLSAQKSQELTIDIEPDLPPMTADLHKLEQILLNLLSNAIKYTPEQGGVRINAHKLWDAIAISVSDTGVGINPEDQGRIFNLFEQVDSSYARHHEGTGLGLALTRELVELHGGKIWVESGGEGKGSTFTFWIPLEPKRRREPSQDREESII
jgi:signal transduction histidine kinase